MSNKVIRAEVHREYRREPEPKDGDLSSSTGLPEKSESKHDSSGTKTITSSHDIEVDRTPKTEPMTVNEDFSLAAIQDRARRNAVLNTPLSQMIKQQRSLSVGSLPHNLKS